MNLRNVFKIIAPQQIFPCVEKRFLHISSRHIS